jgi:hypothetical protein
MKAKLLSHRRFNSLGLNQRKSHAQWPTHANAMTKATQKTERHDQKEV